MLHRRRFLAGSAALALCRGALAAPEAPIVLVDGKTANGAPVALARAAWEAMGSAKIVTHTPWHDGPVTFEGVPARILMQRVGATGDRATIAALDNYTVSVPISDFNEHGALFADRLNGQPMSVEDKGPIMLVYPFDADPTLANETYYSRSIWQIARITIE